MLRRFKVRFLTRSVFFDIGLQQFPNVKKTGSDEPVCFPNTANKIHSPDNHVETDSAPSKKMTVIEFLTPCPSDTAADLYAFGVLPFHSPSSAPATSGKLLLKYATSINYVSYFFYHNTIDSDCQCVSTFLPTLQKFFHQLHSIKPKFPAYKIVSSPLCSQT